MSAADVNGITIDYDDTGSGDDVLLMVHGHPFDRSMWDPQAAHAVGRGWRVIAPDLRGYGKTTVVAGATPLSTFAADHLGLLDHLGVDRFVLVGLSMGGQIAMEIHRLAGPRVRALLLAATSPRAETDESRAARIALGDRLAGEGMAAHAVELLPQMLAPATISGQPDVADHVLGMMWAAPPEGAAAAHRGRAQRQDYVSHLGTVAVPAAVVVGTEDAFTPVSEASLLQAAIPGATLTVVDGVGHLPNLERPAEFNAALDRLLDAAVAA